jgi:glycosyltransferase involved in cell wall biosynthesis
MRIAIVAPHFPEYATNYARALSGLHTVMLCVDDDELRDEFAGREIPLDGIDTLYRMRFKTPADLLKLLRQLARFKPDILHFQEAVGPRRGGFSAIAARAFRRSATIVLTVHDPLPHAGRDAKAARKGSRIRQYVRSLADIVVVHGAFCREQYQRAGAIENQQVVVSQHGLILEPRQLRAKEPTPFRLYMFGRMEAYKGLGVLLAAVEKLHRLGIAFELRLEGRGPELERLLPRFQALPEVSVFADFVPSPRIMDSIQAADCVVLPYLSATQSGVLAAAYAGRRYVIASDTGGIPDVVSHHRNGILVPPGDADALAEAILEAATSEALRQRLRSGSELTAATTLNWDAIARDLSHVFETAAPSRLGRAAR